MDMPRCHRSLATCRRGALLLAAASLLTGLAACSKPTPPPVPAATPVARPTPAVPTSAAIPASTTAATLPPLADIDAQGLQTLLASARGKQAVLVNVWATWCAPCVEEFPLLMELAKAHPDVHFVFISCDFSDATDQTRAFLARQGLTTLSYRKHDDTQDFFPALAPEWDGTLPATAVFHRDGHRITYFTNTADRAALDAALRAATAP